MAIRYLVAPHHWQVSGEDGKPDHRMMGQAWANLHGGARGHPPYEGPHKAEAIAALKRLYEQEGLPLPSEKAAADFYFVVTLATPPETGAVRLPIITTGSWVKNGKHITFTKQDLEDAKANFEKLENHNLNVDYDHASEDLQRSEGGPTPSAGQIFELYPPEPYKDNEWILYGGYEPTKKARELIKNREYRYTSAAFTRSFPDRHTGEDQGLVLTSIALTNDPFLDALPEIQLSGGVRISADGRLSSAEIHGGMTMTNPVLKHTVGPDGVHHIHVHDGIDGAAVHEIPFGHFCHFAANLQKEGHFAAGDLAAVREHFAAIFRKETGVETLTADQTRELLAAGRAAKETERLTAGRKELRTIYLANKPNVDKADGLLSAGSVTMLDLRAAERAQAD